jgi:GNAT superfamily N-acetyltransferase
MANAVTVVLTLEVADRIERALAAAGAARVLGVASVAGNPLELETWRFGDVLADRVARAVGHYHYFSGPRELRDANVGEVATLVEWYRGCPLFVRLAPVFASEVLLGELHGAGLRQSNFMSLFVGAPSVAQPEANVHEVPKGQRQDFVELWRSETPALLEAEFSRGWRCYVANGDGTPAAYGALYIADRVAVCAAAATLPEFRGRGLQTALLRKRINDAHEAGCDLIAVQASPASASERNLRRVGMALAYTKAIWTW